MIKTIILQSTIFLEPVSFAIIENIPVMIPALMYGTQLSTVGNKCVIPGFSYNKFYDVWNCPKIVMEVAVSISFRYAKARSFLMR